MKFKNILIPLLIVPLMSGCQPTKPGSRGGNVLTGDMLAYTSNSNTKKTYTKLSEVHGVSSSGKNTANNGYITAENSDGTISFTSIYSGKEFFKGKISSFYYNVISGVLTLIYIRVQGETTDYMKVYDNFGNLIADATEEETSKFVNAGLSVDQVTPQIQYTDSEMTERTLLFVRTFNFEKGDVYKTLSWKTSGVSEVDYSKESPFMDIDMISLGINGYKARMVSSLSGQQLLIFKGDEYVGAISYPTNAITTANVGTKIIFQALTEYLNDDAEDFDTYYDGRKANIETKVIDFTTCEEEIIDFPLISRSGPIADANKNVNYAQFNILEKDSSNEFRNKSYIVDKNLALHDDVTNNPVYKTSGSLMTYAYLKVGENYFNTVSNILYNSNLQPIKSVNNDFAVQYAVGKGAVVYSYERSKYAFFNESFEQLTPFEYTDVNVAPNFVYAKGLNFGPSALGYTLFDGEKFKTINYDVTINQDGLIVVPNEANKYDVYFGFEKVLGDIGDTAYVPSITYKDDYFTNDRYFVFSIQDAESKYNVFSVRSVTNL